MLRKETRGARLAYAWCALTWALLTAAAVAEVYFNQGTAVLRQLGQLALVSLAFVGKFVIFTGVHEDTPAPWTLAAMAWLIDLAFAFALLSGLEYLERAPLLGSWLRRLRQRALEVLAQYPGLDRMAFFGVTLFVLLPLAATGAITGALVARITGLTRVAGVLAIALGSAGTVITFALLATFLGEQAENIARSPLLAGAAVIVLLLTGRAAYNRVLGRLKEK